MSVSVNLLEIILTNRDKSIDELTHTYLTTLFDIESVVLPT